MDVTRFIFAVWAFKDRLIWANLKPDSFQILCDKVLSSAEISVNI